MPPDTDTKTDETKNDKPEGQQQPPAGDKPEVITSNNGSVLNFTTTSINSLKQEQRRKGRDGLLKELGFSSADELKTLLDNAKKVLKANGAQQPSKPQSNGNGHGNKDRDRRPNGNGAQRPQNGRREEPTGGDADELRERLARLSREKAQSDRKAKNAALERDAVEARSKLEVAAIRVGITEVDFAVELLRKHVQGLDDKQRNAFDENAWFKKLREEKPFLAGERTALANTSPTDKTEAKPPPAQDGQKSADDGAKKPVDATKLSKAEYDKLLTELNLSSPSSGVVGRGAPPLG